MVVVQASSAQVHNNLTTPDAAEVWVEATIIMRFRVMLADVACSLRSLFVCTDRVTASLCPPSSFRLYRG